MGPRVPPCSAPRLVARRPQANLLLPFLALAVRPDASGLRPLIPQITGVTLTPGGRATRSSRNSSASARFAPSTRLRTASRGLAGGRFPWGMAITSKVPNLATVVALHPSPSNSWVTVNAPVSSLPFIGDVNPRRERVRVSLATTSFGWELTLEPGCCLDDVLRSMILIDPREEFLSD